MTGNSVEVEVNNDSQMELTVSDSTEVTIDRKKLDLSDNKAVVSFYAKKVPIRWWQMICFMNYIWMRAISCQELFRHI